jgi:phosphonate transport system substrate-binding protein
MRSISALLVGSLSSLLILGACSSSAEGPTSLRFTAIPGERTAEMVTGFEQVAAYLTQELGVPVVYVPVADYGASVEAFKNGDTLLSWFGGLTGVQARNAVPGARAIAFGKVDPEYKSYFIANPASGLGPSTDFPFGLEGKSFTFGSASSTSGRMMPEYFLRQATGEAPAEFFGDEMHFSGNHDATWQLVQDGTFDAGVLSYKTYDTKLASGEIDPERCFVIWTTPPYADYSWNAHPRLDEEFGAGFIDRLQDALVGMQDPALLAVLMREEGLTKASNADFEALGELARELDLVR